MPSTNRGPGRNGRPWQRLRRQIITTPTHDDGTVRCARCGRIIDPNLSGNHPLGPVVDHVTALVDGGHPTDRANLAAMHRRCNGAKESDRRRRPKRRDTSRDW